MTIKEIHAKAGSLSNYMGYIFLVFLWYFFDNIYKSIKPIFPGSSIEPFVEWGFYIVIVPFLLAGVYGGIHEQQRIQIKSSVSGFFNSAKTHYWRILGANLLATGFILVVSIVIVLIVVPEQSELGEVKLLEYITIPYSAIAMFWFASIVVERNMFRGLLRAIKTLLFNPFALTIGIAWGVMRFLDAGGIDVLSEQTSITLNGIRAAVLAIARILATVYALAVYKHAQSEVLDESSEETHFPISPSTSSNDGLINVSFGFTFVSFLPLFHLVALILGIVALKRNKRFVLRSAIACCIGGFFTIFYLLLIAGWLVGLSVPSSTPGYTFLAEENANLESHVILFDQGLFLESQEQLEGHALNNSDHHWTFDCASALAKFQSYDLDGALADFQAAAEKRPERSEFYYYYGIALLDNDQEEMAAEQFRIALMHEPKLQGAERYSNLINTAYNPPIIISSLLFVIILLILFTLHEYGHAFAAWKLGDDTAKNQGRLTLNPIPHLDIFGSMILPAILLWQQSEFIFGWAKPVPVNPENFKDPQKDHMRVSFAGPAVNLIVSMVCFVILGCIMLFVRLFWPETLSLNFATPFSPISLVGPPFAQWLVIIVAFLKQLFYTSLILGFFNLIPIPPLDGSWILSGLLPQGLLNLFEKTRRFGFVIFLLLVMTPLLNYILTVPIGLAWAGLELLVSAMGLG